MTGSGLPAPHAPPDLSGRSCSFANAPGHVGSQWQVGMRNTGNQLSEVAFVCHRESQAHLKSGRVAELGAFHSSVAAACHRRTKACGVTELLTTLIGPREVRHARMRGRTHIRSYVDASWRHLTGIVA